jgi:hypothetical protein
MTDDTLLAFDLPSVERKLILFREWKPGNSSLPSAMLRGHSPPLW